MLRLAVAATNCAKAGKASGLDIFEASPIVGNPVLAVALGWLKCPRRTNASTRRKGLGCNGPARNSVKLPHACSASRLSPNGNIFARDQFNYPTKRRLFCLYPGGSFEP